MPQNPFETRAPLGAVALVDSVPHAVGGNEAGVVLRRLGTPITLLLSDAAVRHLHRVGRLRMAGLQVSEERR